jgi:hypothetical protein
MCLVLPQKISKAMDAIWQFHNWNGNVYQFGIHVKKIIINEKPANGKLIKIHHKIVDIFMNMWKKFQDFWMKCEREINVWSWKKFEANMNKMQGNVGQTKSQRVAEV